MKEICVDKTNCNTDGKTSVGTKFKTQLKKLVEKLTLNVLTYRNFNKIHVRSFHILGYKFHTMHKTKQRNERAII